MTPSATRQQRQVERQPVGGQVFVFFTINIAIKFIAKQWFFATIDDAVMSIVSPIGEQCSVLSKISAIKTGWGLRAKRMKFKHFCEHHAS